MHNRYLAKRASDLKIEVPEVLIVDTVKLKYLDEIVATVAKLAKVMAEIIAHRNFP